MRLKRLEAHGFKSFASPIRFDFHERITAVVGPNGCGKSNVVDAIKWALGDMSSKSLRGEEMMDVIFKGAAGVAPMGYAEVSLTFDNASRRLPIEFDEVVVTRRLHRTGESEYLLNRAPCRLKDIRELFYGTGVGRDCYSVIEQGRIAFIVDSSPKDRRAIFEEAAGISRYRARKREAESKLERVGQDLQVLDVQVQEIAREIRSLKIQAGKAERFRQHQAAVREKRSALSLHEYHGVSQELDAVRTRLAGLEAERADVARTLAAAREAAAAAEAEARRCDEALAALNGELLIVAQQASALETGVQHDEARGTELADARVRLAGEGATRAAAARRAEDALEAARAGAVQARTVLETARGGVAEAEQRLRQADAACEECRARLAELQTQAVETQRKRAEHQNELVACQTERRSSAARRERVGEDLVRQEAEHAAVRAANEALAAEVARRDQAIAECKARLDAERERVRALDAEITVSAEARARARESRDRMRSREELLRGLESQLEGLSTGVKALLRSPAHAGARFPGICGFVADVLRVEPPYVRAIENLLGERAGWLVAETAGQALAAVEEVSRQGLGGVGVVPRNVRAAAPPAPAESPEGVRPALACVQVDPADAAVASFFLGGYWIAPDRETAIRFLAAAPAGTGAATLDGMVFGPEGTVAGGARDASSSLLSRRAELAALAQDLAALDQDVQAREASLAERQSARAEADRSAHELTARVYDMTTMELPDLRARAEGGRRHEEVLAQELDLVRREQEQLDALDARYGERERGLLQVLGEIDALHGRLEEESRVRSDERARFEASREDLRGRAEGLRQAVVAAEAGCREADGAVARGVEDAIEAQLAEAGAAGALADADRRIAECAQALAAKRESLAAARAERERLDGRLREAAAGRDAVQARLQAEKQRETEVQHRDRALEQELNQGRLDEQRHAMQIEQIVRAAREECGLDIVPLHADWRAPEGFDPVAVRQEIADLRQKMDAMGPVNLAAIDDLKSREERHAYLAGQVADLLKAREQLENLIRKINRESREMFAQTLEKIRENFKGLFRKMFGGGNADIVLEEGVDILEAGVDIQAKPPHKDFTSLHLLSGGEKTLTTLALVMAIFRSNPTPFCLLDEADAALDEKNVDRYTAMVRDFSQDTQFILITHNKRTMTAGDVLYGVTMQTPGVSKRVVVNLEQVRETAGEVRAIEETAAAAVEEPALAGVGAGGAGQ